MKKSILVFLPAVVCMSSLYADGGPSGTGARAAALGGVSATQADAWSAANNPAGTAFLPSVCISAGAENRFLLRELTGQWLAAALPLGNGAFGCSVTRMGDNRYNELHAGISYALKLARKFSAGIRITWLRTHSGSGYGNRHGFSFETGLLCNAARNLTLGVHVLNPIAWRPGPRTPDILPAAICLGAGCRIAKDFRISTEAVKEEDHPLSLRAGVEYQPVPMVAIRAGAGGAPLSFSFGAGLSLGRLTVDLASRYHPVLGFSPVVSLSYSSR